MKIELFTFNKRNNSTKTPSNGIEKGVVLKNATSLYNPTFIMSVYENWNYIKWGNYYYYVDDVIYTRQGVYELQCSIDVLASFKSNILNTSAFVLYSTSHYDTSIIDTRLSMKDVCIESYNQQSISSNASPYYVVSYIGEQGSSNPTVALTEQQLIELMNAIQSNAFAELFNDPTNAINKVLSDTSSCITSCIYNPCCVTEGTKNVILSGGYDTNIVGKGVNKSFTKIYEISIPWNFNSNDFRNRSQFSILSIYLPVYGWVNLNVDNLINQTLLYVKINYDSTTGELTYFINNEIKCTCNVASTVQVSTTTQGNIGSFVSNAIGTVASAYGGFVSGAIVSGFNAITSLVQNSVGSVGSMGGSSAYNVEQNILLVMKSHDTNINPNDLASVYGRPLNQVKKLGDLTGYVQTTNASVSVVNEDISNQINSYLNGGVYIE